VNIGVLDHRARVEYPVSTQDTTYGTPTITWTLLREAWVGVQDEMPSRSEQLKLGVITAAQRTRVRSNYATDIDSSMRLIITRRGTDVTYQIIAGPAILGDNDGIEMMCEEIR
jgi:head-tail adaptor